MAEEEHEPAARSRSISGAASGAVAESGTRSSLHGRRQDGAERQGKGEQDASEWMSGGHGLRNSAPALP